VNLIGHVRGIRALVEVADLGSFSAAAQELGLTQSAVSQHVAALEREVGLTLVQRGTRPAELTEAGRALARHGRQIAAHLDDAGSELGELAGRSAGQLRIGSFPTALATFLPAALARMRKDHPTVLLTVVDDHMQGLLPRLAEGGIDLAVIFDHASAPVASAAQLERQQLFDDAYVAVLPLGHRLTRGRRTLRLSDLAEEVWVGGRPGSTWFHIVRHACQAAGFEPKTSSFSDDYRAVQAFVAAGLGVAVIPGLAAVNPQPGVELRRLAAGAPVRRISVARRADAFWPVAARAMTSFLTDVTRPFRRLSSPPARPRA
jgi:DNA-binding transcriptional LysR family regulator